MKKNGLWVIAFVIVAVMILTVVNPLSINRVEEIDNSTYNISDTPPDNPELGDLWFDTTLDEMNIWNGYVWQNLVPTISGADYKDHVAKHYWGGVDPIEFHKLSPEIRVASEFAESGSGTNSDPYLGAIQNAIDDFPDNGGMVFLPPNTHFREGDIQCRGTAGTKDNVFIQGGGWSTVVELPNMTRKNIFHAIGMDGLVIRDLKLDGNKANQDSDWAMYNGGHGPTLEIWLNGIFIEESSKNILIDNVFIDNSMNNGVFVFPLAPHTIYNVTIRSCVIINSGWISATFAFDVQCSSILGVYADKALASEIGAKYNRIIGCHLEAADTEASICIEEYDVAQGNTINGGYIKVRESNNTISGNVVTGGNWSCLIFGDHNIVSNCIFRDQVHYGIIFSTAGTNNLIIGNTFEGAGGDGVAFNHAGAVNNIVLNNKFIDNSQYGIKEYITTTGLVIKGNIFSGNTLGAMSILGTHTIKDNEGYTTEKSNSTTISNGNTHVTVTHEMDITPTSITVTGNHSEVSACWIVNITSTQFEIWVSSAVTYDRIVYWYAEAR